MARGRSFAKKIDSLRWSRGGASNLAFGAGTLAATIVSDGLVEATIMRTRGSLIAYVDAAQAPGGLVRIGVGILSVMGGQGTTVVSSPLTDGEAPWMWFTQFQLGYEEYVVDVIDCPGITSYREMVDVKAMRKMRPDVELQLVFENITIGGALSVNMAVDLRFLIGE